MTERLVELATVFGKLSLLTIGGVNAVLPELQRQVVTHGWMTAAQFGEAFALAQAAPGPNFLVATLVGLRVAGVAGAAVATACLVGPTCVLTYAVAGVWHRHRAAAWRGLVQDSLTPLTVGLVLAAAIILSEGVATGAGRVALVLAAAAAVLTGRVHPLLVLGLGAALGAIGLV